MKLDGFVDVSEILRSGVYALCHRGVVIYIGKSKTMLGRIYSHRNLYTAKRSKRREVPSWLPIPGIQFDQILVRPCSVDLLDSIEREMIDLYRPRFNTKLKPPGPPLILTLAGVVTDLRSSPQVLRR